MRVTRLLAVPWLALPLITSAAPALAAPGSPASLAPAKTAWFDQSYPTATATPPPLPVGVTADDLYVAGVTVPVTGPPVVPVPAAASTLHGILAVTAMSFSIPNGVSPASLTLVLASAPSTATAGGSAPTGVTLEACPTTSDFQPGGHQPYDQLPAYDCSGRTSVSSLSEDGTSVVFSDIARVARGKVLSVVIRPGTTGADRLVFAAPTSHALSLLDFDSVPVFTPAGTVPPPAQTSGSVEEPRAVSRPNLPAREVRRRGPAAPSAGEAAPEAGHAPSTSRLARPVGAVATDDSRVRILALAGLALLLSAVGWLAVTDQRDEPVDQQWGFGRYRSHREGQAPAL